MTEKELSKQDQIDLKEYEFADKLRENYFTSSWVATSIILPISFGLIGVSYADTLLGLNACQLIPLMLASTFLYLFWVGYVVRYAGYLQSIYKRSRELEKKLGMNLHRLIKKRDTGNDEKEDDEKEAHPANSLRYLNIAMFILLIIAWLFRILLAPISV